jgi:DNA-binding NarL/FixJ family response regulator
MTLSRSNLLVDVLQVVPDLKILLLDAEENEDAFLAAVRAGALGYLPKEVSTQEVVAAVRAAANGEAVCPPRLCLSLFRYIAGQARGIRPCRGPRGLGLTRRQQELVAFIAKGWSNKEIAGNLNLSEQTVKNHVHRILRQLSVENRYEAVEASRAGGLLV